MKLNTDKQKFAHEILATFLNGTKQRGYSLKDWERKIVNNCAKEIGLVHVKFPSMVRCLTCKRGILVTDGVSAFCFNCGMNHNDFQVINSTCGKCGNIFAQYAFNKDEFQYYSRFAHDTYARCGC
jgi:hypothetical protein